VLLGVRHLFDPHTILDLHQEAKERSRVSKPRAAAEAAAAEAAEATQAAGAAKAAEAHRRELLLNGTACNQGATMVPLLCDLYSPTCIPWYVYRPLPL
jgi:hypothetical protein